ncbi:hypothetical protein HK096_004129 [Nowakowskiella sp. JEL0078]|nr:hypothetical protein HK096_004129 [Nowakowskiella sp. JEL0078]
MQTDDTDNFFQSDRDLAIQQARQLKKTSTSNAGTPFFLPSKILALEIINKSIANNTDRDDEDSGSAVYAYTAESGHVARKVNLTTRKVIKVFKGHTGPVTCVAILYDLHGNDEFIITGSWDKTARKWDVKKKTVVTTFSGHTDFIKSVIVFNHFLFTGSSDTTIRQWDHSSGASIRVFKGHTRPVEALTLNYVDDDDDEPALFSGSSDCSVRRWKIADGLVKAVWTGHLTSVYEVKSFDGSVWSASADNTVKRWDVESGTPDSSFDHPDFAKCLTIVNENYLATGSRDENIRIWDIASEECLGILEGHLGEISSLQAVGDTLYSASLDCSIRTWTINATEISTLKKDVKKTEVEPMVDSEAARNAEKGALTLEEEEELAALMDD